MYLGPNGVKAKAYQFPKEFKIYSPKGSLSYNQLAFIFLLNSRAIMI